jgi:hypothetical protein
MRHSVVAGNCFATRPPNRAKTSDQGIEDGSRSAAHYLGHSICWQQYSWWGGQPGSVTMLVYYKYLLAS